MSILSLRDIQGIATYNNNIRIPSGHNLETYGKLSANGLLKIPVWTTDTRPVSPEIGLIGFNTINTGLEIWDGQEWSVVGQNTLGLTQSNPGLSAWDIKERNPTGSTTDGLYWVKPTGYTGDAFQIYADMTTDGGGWTLIDSIVSGETISSRNPGANLDPNSTRGSLLPAYTWSSDPQILGKSTLFTGTLPWRTMKVLTERGKTYPTVADVNSGSSGVAGDFDYAIDNGNTRQGTASWIYVGSSRIGTVWIGAGSNASIAVGYTGGTTGLGTYGTASGSTWVR